MVNICESVLKTVTRDKRKWLDDQRLNQKVRRREASLLIAPRDPRPPGRKPAPAPTLLDDTERGNPVSLPARGQPVARPAQGGAGLGYRKKQTPGGNGSDTGDNITRHESAPTSDKSGNARECVEP